MAEIRQNRRESMLVMVHPRAKLGVAQPPVMMTVEVIRELFDVPRYMAAASLGISETALKKACRKLGVGRWPCKRRFPGALSMLIQARRVASSAAEVAADESTAEVAAESIASGTEVLFSPDSFFNNEIWE